MSTEDLRNLVIEVQKEYNKTGIFPKKQMETIYSAVYPFISKYAASKAKKTGFHVMDDLLQTGYEAICSAVRKYDSTKMDNFFRYSCKWIVTYIKAEQTKNLSLFRFGSREDRKIFCKIANVQHLSQEEQAVALGITRQQLDSFVQATKNPKSLFKKHSDDTDIESEEYLGTDTPNPETLYFFKQLYESIKDVFEDFAVDLRDDRENAIFDLLKRVGVTEKGNCAPDVDDKLPQTYADIADKYGVSRERVRQIACSIKDRLRKRFEKNGFDERSYHAFI